MGLNLVMEVIVSVEPYLTPPEPKPSAYTQDYYIVLNLYTKAYLKDILTLFLSLQQ